MKKSIIAIIITLALIATLAAALAGCEKEETPTVSVVGPLEIYAGAGTPFYADGQSEKAYFNAPKGLLEVLDAVDVADSGNGLVRTLIGGSVYTLAGAATEFDGYGKMTAGYADGGFDKALLGTPEYMCSYGGKILFTDSANNTVRIIGIGARTVGTFLTDGSITLSSPSGIASDDEGNVYVADTGNHRIVKIDANGKASVFAGKGEAGYADGVTADALFFEPCDVAFYQGALYVSDRGNNMIRKIDGGNVTTVAGMFIKNNAVSGRPVGNDAVGKTTLMSAPTGICVVDGIIFVCDSGNNSVKAIFEDGSSVLLFGGEQGFAVGEGGNAKLNAPSDVAVIGEYIYVSDTANNAVRRATISIDEIKKIKITNSIVETVDTRSAVVYSIVTDGDDAVPVVIRGAETTEAFEGMRLTVGDTVRTDGSSVVYIKIDDDKTIRLDKYSEMTLSSISSKKMRLSLTTGSFFFNVENKLSDSEDMAFTSGGTTMSIRGTSGKVEMTMTHADMGGAPPSVSTTVLDGEVDVTYKNDNDHLGALETLTTSVEEQMKGKIVDMSELPPDIFYELKNNDDYRRKFVASCGGITADGKPQTGSDLMDYLDSIDVNENALFSDKTTEPCKDGEHTVKIWYVINIDCENFVCEGTCTKCGEKVTKTENHGHKYIEETTPATCAEDGKITKTCTACGHTETEVIEKTAHSFDGGVITKPATCAEEGEVTFTCDHCGETITGMIMKTDHMPETVVGTLETCDKDGLTDGTVCAVCGKVLREQITIVATGHEYKLIETVKPSCTEYGHTAYACEKCGDTIIGEEFAPLDHKPSDWKIDDPPTCQMMGQKHIECTECGAILEKAPIDKLDHTPGDWMFDIKPECMAGGHKHIECTECGAILEETDVGPLDHDFSCKVVDEKYYFGRGQYSDIYCYYLSCSICGKSSNDYDKSFFTYFCGHIIEGEENYDAHEQLPCGHFACEEGSHEKLACGCYACQVGNDHAIYNCGDHCNYKNNESHSFIQVRNNTLVKVISFDRSVMSLGTTVTLPCGATARLKDIFDGNLPCDCCEVSDIYLTASEFHSGDNPCGHCYCQISVDGIMRWSENGFENHEQLPCRHFECDGGSHKQLSCGCYECQVSENHKIFNCGKHCSDKYGNGNNVITVIDGKKTKGIRIIVTDEEEIVTLPCGVKTKVKEILAAHDFGTEYPCDDCSYSIVHYSADDIHDTIECENGHNFCEGKHNEFIIKEDGKWYVYCGN